MFAMAAALLLWNRKTLPALLIWLAGGGMVDRRMPAAQAAGDCGPCPVEAGRGHPGVCRHGILMNYALGLPGSPENKEKTFGRYVDPAVIRELMENNAAADLGGSCVAIAVLFVDIRGFTALSETCRRRRVVGNPEPVPVPDNGMRDARQGVAG